VTVRGNASRRNGGGKKAYFFHGDCGGNTKITYMETREGSTHLGTSTSTVSTGKKKSQSVTMLLCGAQNKLVKIFLKRRREHVL